MGMLPHDVRLQRFITLPPDEPFDVRQSFMLQALGHYDPTARLDGARFEKRFVTPGSRGAEVNRVIVEAEGGGLSLTAEGPWAEAALSFFAGVLPPRDGYVEFAPASPLLRRLHRERPGLRLVPVPWPFDVAVGAVLQQRVEWGEAATEYRRLVETFGARDASGGLALCAPVALARRHPRELERLGIDHQRALALIALSREEVVNPLLHRFLASGLSMDTLQERLVAIPGIGPWTAGMIRGFAFGDPDAVILGDVHIPHNVAKALANEPHGDDARMLELLAPLAGHRFRAVRLIVSASSKTRLRG